VESRLFSFTQIHFVNAAHYPYWQHNQSYNPSDRSMSGPDRPKPDANQGEPDEEDSSGRVGIAEDISNNDSGNAGQQNVAALSDTEYCGKQGKKGWY
jgi:hypothetical protein